VVESLVGARTRAARSPLTHLTPRERDVLSEMAQGRKNAAIAASLVLTERGVEKHINSIFAKLALSDEPDVHRRVKAVLLFLTESGAGER
jgi:DNA-binding NarL/FixJ family response regulator